MKKTIEIECPDGYKPVYNPETGKIEMVTEDITAVIKTYEDARKYLGADAISYNKSIDPLAKLMTILDALNKGHEFDLLRGVVWHPRVYFYKVPPKDSTVIGHFRYKYEKFALVGEYAYSNCFEGLGAFDSSAGRIRNEEMFACKSEEIARYVSVQFGKLLFEACFARHFKKGEFEWL